MANLQQRSQYWRQFGLQQIDRELHYLDQRLQSSSLSSIDRLFWQGRRRELRLAAAIVRRLTPTPTPPPSATAPSPAAISLGVQPPTDIIPTTTEKIFRAVSKDYRSLENLTGHPLEIDILQVPKRQQLLQIICQQFQQTLQALQADQVTPEQLLLHQDRVLADIWADSTTQFFGRYYTLAVFDQPVEVVPTLLADRELIIQQLLHRIPLTTELLAYLLWQEGVYVDNRLQAYDTVPANAYIQDLLANTIIQIANAVVQPFLNRFSDLEPVKQKFYHPDLLATRDITRFRNHLSWHYYLQAKYLQPIAIFESRYQLAVLRPTGIDQRQIYAPRRPELSQLQGLPWLVTILLEIRDAIAPPWQAVTTFLGNVLVYVLTEIIGRGLGLVGRGILQGLGQAWQERR
jgi:Protein of unknown function (DUF3685)